MRPLLHQLWRCGLLLFLFGLGKWPLEGHLMRMRWRHQYGGAVYRALLFEPGAGADRGAVEAWCARYRFRPRRIEPQPDGGWRAVLVDLGEMGQGPPRRLRLDRGVVGEVVGGGITADVRQQVGQGLVLALLSGFRAVVADFVWIQAHGDWMAGAFYRMPPKFDLITYLQPKAAVYWDMASWHMAWNFSVAALRRNDLPREIQRLREARRWIAAGEAFARRGVQLNPDRWELYFAWGRVLYYKAEDFCAAAEAFLQADRLAGAPAFVGRMAGHALYRCGDYRRAYEQWKSLWFAERGARPHQLYSVIEKEIRRLESILNVPSAERVFPGERLTSA